MYHMPDTAYRAIAAGHRYIDASYDFVARFAVTFISFRALPAESDIAHIFQGAACHDWP